ncbi:MAG: hypothetical protein EZS28_041356 [Streblomastix strix]|uniref:General transcription factor IIH subunit 4 n=1 Tax=Streblomastix strix TaxID=222440 RepID=A0A5J4TYD0_9EUKA|nr:MAG: hypothetical protein EZS28_041356 [Streblomastix strix]
MVKSLLEIVLGFGQDLKRLYSQGNYAILSIMKFLSPLEKQLILRLANLNTQYVPQDLLIKWIDEKRESLISCQEAIQTLCQLEIFIYGLLGSQKIVTFALNDGFKKILMESFCGLPPAFPNAIIPRQLLPSLSIITKYAVERWESILFLMVGAYKEAEKARINGQVEQNQFNVIDLLCRLGLVIKTGQIENLER